MWPIIFGALRTYAPYVTWPIAAVIGFVGYNFETLVRGDKQTPYKIQSIEEERNERLLEAIDKKDMTQVESLNDRKSAPKTIFGKNDPSSPNYTPKQS